MIITAKGKAGKDLRPVDVDREFVVAFMSTEEYESWYIKENLNKYAAKAKEFSFQREVFGDDIAIGPHGAPYQPIMENINGYLYGNGPVLTSKPGEHLRWYVIISRPRWVAGRAEAILGSTGRHGARGRD